MSGKQNISLTGEPSPQCWPLVISTNLSWTIWKRIVLAIGQWQEIYAIIFYGDSSQTISTGLIGYTWDRPTRCNTFSHKYIPIKLSCTCFEKIIVHNQEVTSVHAAYSILPRIYGLLAARHPIDARWNTVCCVYRNNLLMINNYLFQTCTGSLIRTN